MVIIIIYNLNVFYLDLSTLYSNNYFNHLIRRFHINHTVAGQIREIMEADFRGLYYNMTHTPLEVQRRWFKSFAVSF